MVGNFRWDGSSEPFKKFKGDPKNIKDLLLAWA